MGRILASIVFGSCLCGLPALAQSGDTVRSAQQVLKDKGLYSGSVDGIYGPLTRKAVRSYQQEQNLTADGRLGPQTLSALGVQEATPGTSFGKAGSQVKNSYAAGGKDVGRGGKEFGSEIKHGNVVEAGKELGKGVGSGAAKIGEGTGHAAKSAASGVKNAVTPNKKDTTSTQQ
ncbi:MAG TPA: peptidoglycan-binding domain-containing protein [Bryobacteraceae bacterium]